MKKTLTMFILATVLILISGGISFSVDSGTKSEINTLPYEFKVVANGYYKKVLNDKKKWDSKYVRLDKPVTMIDFTKNNIVFYDTVEFESSTEKYVCPKLDKDGNSIPVPMSSADFEKKALNTLHDNLQLVIAGNVPSKIFLGMIKKQKGFVGPGRFFKSDRPKDISIGKIVQADIQKPYFSDHLSMIYSDKDMSYQVRQLDDKGCSVIYQKSVNPDIDEVFDDFLMFEMVDSGYWGNEELGKGYLSISPNKKEFMSNGKTSTLDYYPKMVNNKLFVYAQWFIPQVYGYIAHVSDDEYVINRLCQKPGGPIKLIDFHYVRGEDVVTMNGKTYKLSATPICEEYYTMMPLRDLCELLKVRLIYQPITNTYLIQRFNSKYDTPFNLKEVVDILHP